MFTTILVADPEMMIKAISHACNALIDAEPEITRQDQIAGDGDAGTTLKAGATGQSCRIGEPISNLPSSQGVLKAIEEQKLDGKDLIQTMRQISEVADEAMGGTSGALYSYVFDFALCLILYIFIHTCPGSSFPV
jgi:dihydroxyacetone kinase